MKKENFERRCEEMRNSVEPLASGPKPVVVSVSPARERLSLRDAATELGVSYSTARRIFIAEKIGRYSAAGDTPVYPSTPLKRFQVVRMTYIITDADIDRVKRKMCGGAF